MKFMKVTTVVGVEIFIPAGTLTQEDIDELHSAAGQKQFYEASLAEAKKNAEGVNGELISFESKAEIVEV